MNWESALAGGIEVSIAIAGFAGVVAAVNRREDGTWTATDQLLLEMLLTGSAISCAFSFLPFVLLDVLDENVAWRTGSALQVLWIFGISIFRSRQARRMGADYVGSASVGFMAPVMLVALVVLTANIAIWGAAWPYVIGVLALITTGFNAFVRLLLGTRSSRELAGD
jgi:hypothetical protein